MHQIETDKAQSCFVSTVLTLTPLQTFGLGRGQETTDFVSSGCLALSFPVLGRRSGKTFPISKSTTAAECNEKLSVWVKLPPALADCGPQFKAGFSPE